MGEIKCRINIHGNVREYVPETTYKQLAKEYQKQFPDDIVLVLVNNRMRELRYGPHHAFHCPGILLRTEAE